MRVIVHPHKIEIVKDEAVNEKEIDISKCYFEFDEEITDDYVKEAYFTLKDNTYKQIIQNNKCDFPSEVLEEKGDIELGVVAFLVENEEEIKRYNPSPAYFDTWKGSLKTAQNSEEITPTDKEQIETMLNNINITAEKVDTTTTITITNTDGESQEVEILDGEDGPAGPQGEPGHTPVKGIDYFTPEDIASLNIPRKTSDLNNDSGFITSSTDTLTNYYKKSETYNKTEIDSKISSVYKYKGSVASYEDLPSEDLTIGDVYNVETDGSNYAWDGVTWDKLGGDVDLSNYYNKTQTDNLLSGKVDTSALESIILGTDIETGIKNYFALTRDEKTYSVEWYTFATDTGTTMAKTDDNANLVCNPSTDTVSGTNNYPTAFDTIDVNAFVDSEGIRHVTFARGQEGFGETEDTIQDVIYKGVTYKQDVFVLGRTYYQKFEYNSVSGKNKYSRRYVPTNGYTPVSMAINKDGTVNPFWLIAKYESGLDSDGKLRSLKGLLPGGQRNIPVGSCSTSVLNSYNNQITNYHNRGTYYTGMLASEWSHLMTTFWLKYATKDFQSKMAGCTGYDYQYTVAATESNVSRVKLTTAQANNLVIGSSLSVGDNSVTPTTYDRVNGYVHKYADSAVITSIEVDPNDNTYSYVNLDCSPFTTTAITFVKTMPWRSGFSTNLLGRDGSPNNLTDSKNPASLDGIEFMVGAYDVIGNVIASYDSNEKVYDYYVCNDSTKLTTDTSNLSNYIHSSVKTNCTTNNAWNYIADVDLDLTSGLCIGSNVGGTNTSSSRGFCDGYYVSSASGFRELLAFGCLYHGAAAGVSCVGGHSALSAAGWNCLSRLSINALGGS